MSQFERHRPTSRHRQPSTKQSSFFGAVSFSIAAQLTIILNFHVANTGGSVIVDVKGLDTTINCPSYADCEYEEHPKQPISIQRCLDISSASAAAAAADAAVTVDDSLVESATDAGINSGCQCSTGYELQRPGCRCIHECTECGQNEYEILPCQHNRDRICVHVNQPWLTTDLRTNSDRESNSTSQSDMLAETANDEGLLVETSGNIFTENIRNTRNLETTFYVTDRKQQTDFLWYRESGIRINVGLQNIDIIPVYEDVDHEGDNEYMMGRSIEERANFEEILQKHCRYPIPSYYTLTVEVMKDRTTAAHMESCTLERHRRGTCTGMVQVGDQFVWRSLNEPCEKMGYFPIHLKTAANSIVCTQGGAILKDLFNLTESSVRPIPFPPESCRPSTAKCDYCSLENDCQSKDELERSCCYIDCYTRSDCKQVTSHQCKSSRVECATGDAYRYTLHPIYPSIQGGQFNCHIRRHIPDTLYRLWFYISVPGTHFETPRIYKKVGITEESTKFEFLTIVHNMGIRPEDEFILVGKGWKDQNSNEHWNHTVHSMNKPEQSGEGVHPFSPHTITPSFHELSIQFHEPFSYSTSTWVDGASSCLKDSKRFSTVVNNDADVSGPLIVDKMTSSDKETPFEYLLRSLNNSPNIAFTIPANTSVLRWWFKGKNASLIIDDTLKTSLRLDENGTAWRIRVSGIMTRCPGYLQVTIDDRLDLRELFKNDFLVECPPSFDLDISVPILEDETRRTIENTFDVTLDDSRNSYHVFLSSFRFTEESQNTSCQMASIQSQLPLRNWTPYLLIWIGVLFLFGVPLGLFILPRNGNLLVRHSIDVAQVSKSLGSDRVLHYVHHVTDDDHSTVSPHDRKHYQTLIIAYVIVQFVFGSLLTFTTVFLCFSAVCRHHFGSMQEIGEVKLKFFDLVNEILLSLEDNIDAEFSRQTQTVAGMQNACEGHSSELIESFFTNELAAEYESTPLSVSEEGSLSHLLETLWNTSRNRFQKDLESFVRKHRQRIHEHMWKTAAQFNASIFKFLLNSWLLFPRNLSKKTATPSEFQSLDQTHNDFHLDKDHLKLIQFLQLHRVQVVHASLPNYWNKFDQLLSSLNSAFPNNAVKVNNCANTHVVIALKDTSQNYSQRTDTTRFVTALSQNDGSNDFEFVLWEQRERTDDLHLTISDTNNISNSLKLEAILAGFSWKFIKGVFITLDLIIFVLRISQAYNHISKIKNGIRKTILITVENGDTIESLICRERTQFETGSEVDTMRRISSECDSFGNISTDVLPERYFHRTRSNESHFSMHAIHASFEKRQTGQRKPEAIPSNSEGFQQISSLTVMSSRWMLNKSLALSRTVVICVLVIFLNLGVQLTTTLVQKDILLNFMGIKPLMRSMDSLVEEVNMDLRDLAEYNTIGQQSYYSDQAGFELAQLRALRDFYFNEKERRIKQLRSARVRSTDRRHHSVPDREADGSWLPDEKFLPCQFTSIPPVQFSVCDQACLHNRSTDGYVAMFHSLHQLAVDILNTFLVVVAIATFAHAIEMLGAGLIRARRHSLSNADSFVYVVPASYLADQHGNVNPEPVVDNL